MFSSLKCQTLNSYVKTLLKLIPYENLELYFQLYRKFQARNANEKRFYYHSEYRKDSPSGSGRKIH